MSKSQQDVYFNQMMASFRQPQRHQTFPLVSTRAYPNPIRTHASTVPNLHTTGYHGVTGYPPSNLAIASAPNLDLCTPNDPRISSPNPTASIPPLAVFSGFDPFQSNDFRSPSWPFDTFGGPNESNPHFDPALTTLMMSPETYPSPQVHDESFEMDVFNLEAPAGSSEDTYIEPRIDTHVGPSVELAGVPLQLQNRCLPRRSSSSGVLMPSILYGDLSLLPQAEQRPGDEALAFEPGASVGERPTILFNFRHLDFKDPAQSRQRRVRHNGHKDGRPCTRYELAQVVSKQLLKVPGFGGLHISIDGLAVPQENIVLLRVDHVSQGTLQPILGYTLSLAQFAQGDNTPLFVIMNGELKILPIYAEVGAPRHRRLSRGLRLLLGAALLLAGLQYLHLASGTWSERESVQVPLRAPEWLDKCRLLNVKPGPPPDFHTRKHSDRFVPGMPAALITNATIWTGGDNGNEVIKGDVLLADGLIKRIGAIDASLLSQYPDIKHVNGHGKWLTPGQVMACNIIVDTADRRVSSIVDMHSHLGVDSAPALNGANDGNSAHGPILPWLRALDGLNTRDDAYALSISGGLTTANVLPGSANAIGGQAVLIKLRHTDDRAPTGMLLENPYETNRSVYDPHVSFRYRQLKQACGENPHGWNGLTRMDTAWKFREAYETARKIKVAQDEFCAKAMDGDWAGLGDYPEDLQWEALVDVLRGRVKVHTHCYETVDLDDLVRISNEFKFPIAAFHHAHETYLVPDTLKAAYGHPPASALFATEARYKREAFRGSEFAPKILAEHGLQVVMKSDHPVLNSRYLLFEAQQAHYYGLPPNLALAAVTSTPATVLGQSHRIGFLRPGYDADVVLWDSHPLSLGATPQQVWIDGIPQFSAPHLLSKPDSFQVVPKTPNWDQEIKETMKYDGLPPLMPRPASAETVVFNNIRNLWLRDAGRLHDAFSTKGASASGDGVVIVRRGAELAFCAHPSECGAKLAGLDATNAEFVDLEGGAISPALTSVGTLLGLAEIDQEPSTHDGEVADALNEAIPDLAGGSGALIRAVDGLIFGTRDALLAYRAGVTTAISAPESYGFMLGLNAAFSTGAAHRLARGAVVQETGAVHVAIHMGAKASVSTQIATLRALFLGNGTSGDVADWFARIRAGGPPLVVHAQSADVIASVVALKKEVEARGGARMRWTIMGATEAPLLARELGEAGVGVIFTRARPFPEAWENRRMVPGPPLTPKSALVIMKENNVTAGIGITETWDARNARFDLAWAALEADGAFSKADALALASLNVETLLGVESDGLQGDLVATKGGDLFGFSSKVVGVISARRGLVDLL
ncbi:uncharacterized protein BXZ73DRAFT_106870 [Epithele typhae]|uniref:uncharacterized protein n=1 Tax=Epithele typhae TaxID=378194 RepID=UPI002007B438|nr:uncharacterized protein BXZ73DRAFT_106870 [Epithele typhae]KAH9913691.1 hypothetical protein BXZ73DRAFT_106870 [Epithele typhae]